MSVRASATNHGLRVDKWLGDGAMLVSVACAPLISAVVEIKQAFISSPLALRAGIAEGPVMVFDGDDYVGSAVNLAAKLCDLAAPNQCLAPQSVADVCPTGIGSRPIGERHVPGFHQPIPLVELEALPPSA
jgi:class 3 adenylate cyclase